MKKSTFVFIGAVLLQSGFIIPAEDSRAAENKGKAPTTKTVKKAKSRTLKELIKLTVEKGREEPLSIILGEDVGFLSDVPAKSIISGEGDEIKYTHIFYAIYESSLVGAQPDGLLFRTIKDWKSTNNMEEWMFRTKPDGTILRAVRRYKETLNVSMPLESEETKQAFKVVLDFFLKDTASVKFKQKK